MIWRVRLEQLGDGICITKISGLHPHCLRTSMYGSAVQRLAIETEGIGHCVCTLDLESTLSKAPHRCLFCLQAAFSPCMCMHCSQNLRPVKSLRTQRRVCWPVASVASPGRTAEIACHPPCSAVVRSRERLMDCSESYHHSPH